MKLDELQQMAEIDMKQDDLELADESLRNASLHQKYLNHLNHYKQLLIMKRGEYNILKRKKWEYYSGKSDPEVYRENPFDHKILKADLHIYLDSDKEMVEMKQLIEYYEMCVSTCESIMKNVSDRQWNIKNAIAWRKFVDGAI